MFISHRGSNDTITKAEVEYALEWYIKRLIGPHLAARLSVNIVHRNLDEKGDKGSVIAHFENDYKHPRRFLLEISTILKKAPVLRVLAHESVHIKQYVYGELWDHNSPELVGMTFWKKRNINEKDYKKYRERPWEKEAYRVEKSLYAAYKRHKEKEKLIF